MQSTKHITNQNTKHAKQGIHIYFFLLTTFFTRLPFPLVPLALLFLIFYILLFSWLGLPTKF